jgi:cytochrome c-type biogenesis protein
LFEVTWGGAFLAGMISFVTPCVLPLVPSYLCFLAGISLDELRVTGGRREAARDALRAAFAFVLGFTTVFVALGATATFIGQTLADHFDLLAVIAGSMIIVMGLHFLGAFRIGIMQREARFQIAKKPAGFVGAYGIGLAFAFGWTPCIGPVLAAILFVAGGEETVGRGAALLATYSLGLGLPFLLAAAFAGPFLRWASGFRHNLAHMGRAVGGLLVVTGILFITGQMETFSYLLLETFPALGKIG